MTRKFKAGDKFYFGGMGFTVRKGRKSEDDLVLCWYINGRYIAIPMSVVALMVEFFCENEDFLYPRSKGFMGKYKFIRFMEQAYIEGHQEAIKTLQKEKNDALRTT